MAILERVRGGRGTADLGQLAKDLRDDLVEELPAIRQEALEVAERVLEAASRAVEAAGEGAGQVAERAPVADVAAAGGDALARAGVVAGRTGDSIGQTLARASREVNLDGRIDDVAKRIRQGLSSERLTTLVAGLERGLPTTDRDLYDRAYARGWTRARTSFVGVGMVAGILAGIAGAFLFDPARGAQRRAMIGEKARSVGGDASKIVGGKAAAATTRARAIIDERRKAMGTATQDPAPDGADPTAPAAPVEPAGLVPVMDPDVSTSTPAATSLSGA